jgi:peptide/nickel transport system substrate-binding protein
VPHVDQVIFKTFTDNDAMVAALQSNAIDLAAPVPAKDMERLKMDRNIVLGQPGSIVYELRINGARAPVNSKALRQALHWAIDRQGIVDRVLYRASSPTAIPFDTFSPAYDPKYKDRYSYDLNKAKEMLTAAGLKPTDTIGVLQPANVPENLEMAQVFQADMAKIGFKVNIETLDQAQYLPRVLAGDYMCLFSTSVNLAKYPTRIALNTVWRTAENPIWKNDVPKSYVAAIEEANSTLDPAKQKVAFGKLVDALLDESWVISIAWRQTLFGLQKHVKGFEFTVDDMMMLENAWLDK